MTTKEVGDFGIGEDSRLTSFFVCFSVTIVTSTRCMLNFQLLSKIVCGKRGCAPSVKKILGNNGGFTNSESDFHRNDRQQSLRRCRNSNISVPDFNVMSFSIFSGICNKIPRSRVKKVQKCSMPFSAIWLFTRAISGARIGKMPRFEAALTYFFVVDQLQVHLALHLRYCLH